MQSEVDTSPKLARRLGRMLGAIVHSLDEVDFETRQRMMELCGEACAIEDGDLDIAKKIGETANNITEVVKRVNEELLWCGTWSQKGETIESVCTKCGCPLVRNEVINRSETWCYCSRGWVKRIFETALKKPLAVELKKSIGRGDGVCKFVVRIRKQGIRHV